MPTALIKGSHPNWVNWRDLLTLCAHWNEGWHKILPRCFIIKGKFYANYFKLKGHTQLKSLNIAWIQFGIKSSLDVATVHKGKVLRWTILLIYLCCNWINNTVHETIINATHVIHKQHDTNGKKLDISWDI